jgi:L,D-peptidoglycan transpeptidase YkuD (ErfK/YbiS/YcfS/YnhG family)
MTATVCTRRGLSLPRAALIAPLALGLAAGPAMSAFAQPADDDGTTAEDSTVLDVPNIEDIEIPGLDEPGFVTTATWSAETEVITDLTTEEGPIGDGLGKEPIDPQPDEDEDEGEDGSGDEDDGDEDDGDEGTDPAGEQCDVDTDAASAEKVVLVEGTAGSDAEVSTCEKQDDGTYDEVDSYDGHVGYNGISDGPRTAGDGTTPSGTFELQEGFGHKEQPAGHEGEWNVISDGDVWVGADSYDDYPERLNSYEAGGAEADPPYQGEDLWEPEFADLYQYAWVLDFNRGTDPDHDPTEGAAIFLHVNGSKGQTEGCISLPEDDLLDVFAWADGDTPEMQITN